MDYPELRFFDNILIHRTARDIIRNRSTNRNDVRDEALSGLRLDGVVNVLDIGCGFGFMAEKYATMISPAARVTGIDLFENNRSPFEEIIRGSGRVPEFLCREITTSLPFDDRSCDLVIASYSLYFFPYVLPEVSRIMTDDGMFISITHSENSFTGLYQVMGLTSENSLHPELLKKFSTENGLEKLKPYFRNVFMKEYRNSLIFEEKHAHELLTYALFKLPLLLKNIDADNRLPRNLEKNVQKNLEEKKCIIIEKNDAIFHCRGPLCR